MHPPGPHQRRARTEGDAGVEAHRRGQYHVRQRLLDDLAVRGVRVATEGPFATRVPPRGAETERGADVQPLPVHSPGLHDAREQRVVVPGLKGDLAIREELPVPPADLVGEAGLAADGESA